MKNTIFLLSLVLFFSCKPDKRHEEYDISPDEIIDFYSFEECNIKEIPASLIKNIRYINIDATKNDFLFKGIDKIKVRHNQIYILDRRLKKLVVFDNNGQGIGTVGAIGQGPGEYIGITDFDVDTKGNIYLIDGITDKMLKFDEKLQFVDSKNLPFEADIIQCIPNENFMIGLSSWNEGENKKAKIILVDKELNTLKSYFEYDEFVDPSYWISHYAFIVAENKVIYNQPIDNNIYEFTDLGELNKIYRIDFGKRNVPNDDKKEIEKNLKKYENYACLKNFTFIGHKYIIGTIYEKAKTKFFIVDKTNNLLYKSGEIADRDVSYIIGYEDNNILSVIYPGKYDDLDSLTIPEDVKTHLKNDNFVVCISDLK